MAAEGYDTVTQRPRTPNDQYTLLTDTQIHNIQKETSPFFRTIQREVSLPNMSREGGRVYKDRYCAVTNEHLLRGVSATQPYTWIDFKKERLPPVEYNTCRGRASVRWGPNKAGERTRSHFFGESIDRYTNIDMYRRNPTNHPGRVVMDCGRPADGYYAQKFPAHTTWFGSSVPLNRTEVINKVQRKTTADYHTIKSGEQMARRTRVNEWPEFSEYTDRFLLNTPTERRINNLEEKKKHLQSTQSAIPMGAY